MPNYHRKRTRVTGNFSLSFLHTGNCSEHGTWEFNWEVQYCTPARKLLATVPTFLTPGGRDFAGAVNELHYTPAKDSYNHNWSKVIGPIRIIGLDGNQIWKVGGENYQWLEKELESSKENYLLVMEAYPAYSSGKHSKKPYPWLMQSREIIMPLLGKHNVTALISGTDPSYERCEPTPDMGCTQIVTGAAGKDCYRYSGSAIALNPFASGKGREWAGADGVRSFCIFDLKKDTLEFKVLELNEDTNVAGKILDKKTFSPRRK